MGQVILGRPSDFEVRGRPASHATIPDPASWEGDRLTAEQVGNLGETGVHRETHSLLPGFCRLAR